MKRVVTFLLLAFLALPSPAMAASLPAMGSVEVYFSPNGGAEAAVVREGCSLTIFWTEHHQVIFERMPGPRMPPDPSFSISAPAIIVRPHIK